MLPVRVHLLWFEMLLVKVSVVFLPQYLSRCLAFGMICITWLVRILHCPCWVCSALCIQSGVQDWSRFLLFLQNRSMWWKRTSKISCRCPPFPCKFLSSEYPNSSGSLILWKLPCVPLDILGCSSFWATCMATAWMVQLCQWAGAGLGSPLPILRGLFL